MDGILFLKFLHLLALVYWLGGDLGTFYASRFVVKSDLPEAARATAFKIMMGCDQGPRFAMPLIFPLGFELAQQTGFADFGQAAVGVVWLVCFIWFAGVVTLHFAEGKSFIPALQKFDFGLRVVVVLAVIAMGVMALGDDRLAETWVATKMIIFAVLVFCGLMVRIALKPFGPAWVSMLTNGASEDTDKVIAGAIGKARPWVFMIWAGLFVNTAFGLHLIG